MESTGEEVVYKRILRRGERLSVQTLRNGEILVAVVKEKLTPGSESAKIQ